MAVGGTIAVSDEWMPVIELAISIEEFQQLPRNAAYKYEYFGGRAVLSPRPKHFHAVLELGSEIDAAELETRPVGPTEIDELVPVFAAAFDTTQPFGSLNQAKKEIAARQALERTFGGHDGPLITPACLSAIVEGRTRGAILVTLVPTNDDSDIWPSYRWETPPPADCIQNRSGSAHLTWIFMAPRCRRRGLGSGLLRASARALWDLGFRELHTTFVLGNDSSALWHWRNGFQLRSHPGSMRRISSLVKKE
jgi:GNAT superfamily N-acetyltransferase